MNHDLSHRTLVAFLKTAGEKGWMNPRTAAAMRSVAKRVVEVLEPHELQDVSTIDVASVMRRFANKNTSVSPDSLRTYASRMEAAITTFRRSREDPTSWMSGSGRSRTASSTEAPRSPGRIRTASRESGEDSKADEKLDAPPLVFPFPLRSDVIVIISGVPRDLKTIEADRIGAFMRSLAQDFEP